MACQTYAHPSSALELDERRAALVAMERLKNVGSDVVRRLRHEVFLDGVVNRDEADALFDLERSVRSDCPEWSEFFVETIVDYLLWQQRPSGVLSEAQAEWLIGQADQTRSLAAFATLVAVLQDAHRTPIWYAAAVKGRAAKGWPCLEAARAA